MSVSTGQWSQRLPDCIGDQCPAISHQSTLMSTIDGDSLIVYPNTVDADENFYKTGVTNIWLPDSAVKPWINVDYYRIPLYFQEVPVVYLP